MRGCRIPFCLGAAVGAAHRVTRRWARHASPLHSTPNLRRKRRRSEEHTSELQSQSNLVCRLLLEKKNRAYIATVALLLRVLRICSRYPFEEPFLVTFDDCPEMKVLYRCVVAPSDDRSKRYARRHR